MASLLLAPGAHAQNWSRYDFGAAYVFTRLDSSGGALSLNGVRFSLARNVNRWLAMEGEGVGLHVEGFRLGTILAGPRFTVRAHRAFELYGHVLAGWAHANAAARGFPAYHDSAAWAAGSGLNWRLNLRVSLSFPQLDFLQTRLGSGVQQNLRAGAGIIFHFGDVRN